MADRSPDEPTATSTNHFSFSSSSSSSSVPSLKALPRPISIRHSQSYDPSPLSPSSRPRKSLTPSRSSNSLSLLSSPTSPSPHPSHPHLYNSNAPNTSSDASHEYELRSQVSPLRSSPFSNPFRKLQNSFGGGKKSLDLGHSNGPLSSNNNNNNNYFNSNSSQSKPEKVVSSSSSASSLNSWRSKGAEILSKSWGRSRKSTYHSLAFALHPYHGLKIDRGTPTHGSHVWRHKLYSCLNTEAIKESGGRDQNGVAIDLVVGVWTIMPSVYCAVLSTVVSCSLTNCPQLYNECNVMYLLSHPA